MLAIYAAADADVVAYLFQPRELVREGDAGFLYLLTPFDCPDRIALRRGSNPLWGGAKNSSFFQLFLATPRFGRYEDAPSARRGTVDSVTSFLGGTKEMEAGKPRHGIRAQLDWPASLDRPHRGSTRR